MASGYGKTYVVWVGRNPGIYGTWDDCKAEVENYPNARYKAFSSRTEAIMAYRASDKDAAGVLRAISDHLKQDSAQSYMDNPEVNLDSIAVDAACSGNPGVMEYRGVYLRSGKEIFRMGPFPHGTNNIGEFLAIVHCLALLKKNGSDMAIYSDSMVAQKWVRDKKCKTKLERNDKNSQLHDLVARAEHWLESNTYANPILKWQTEHWGEIPADFGRK